jgi:DNA-binding CsgD family transcriptional regulator
MVPMAGAGVGADHRALAARALSARRMTPVPVTALAPPPDALPAQAAARLVGAIGSVGFAASALDALNAPVRAASWSVYRLFGRGRPPVLHLSATQGGEDVTRSCFAAYAAGLYRRDRSFDLVRRAHRPGEPAVLAMHADEAPNPEHREAIYRRHALAERLSVAAIDDDGSLLAVNLYHHDHQGRFSAAERDRFCALAPVLLASVRRHVEWQAERAAAPADARAALAAACPALTARELDVCERLLRGMSHDGIAVDLGLSVPTVKTYRARAFERLGLHFRSELFARFGAVGRAPASPPAACRPLG